jgi:hypothetical protein
MFVCGTVRNTSHIIAYNEQSKIKFTHVEITKVVGHFRPPMIRWFVTRLRPITPQRPTPKLYVITLSPSTPVAPTASVKRFVSLQFLNPKTVGKSPWVEDQSVARPLPTHGLNADIIHVLSGIRTRDPSVRVSEDSSCLRPRNLCGRPPVDCQASISSTVRHFSPPMRPERFQDHPIPCTKGNSGSSVGDKTVRAWC